MIALRDRNATQFGMAYAVGDEMMGIDVLSEPAVNVSEMSVRMRISTPALDRDRQVVNQHGIRLDYYRDNPVVLFGHGEQGIVLPVAMSEDFDGQCTVMLLDDGNTYAKAFHRESDKTSSQMFDAVNSGLLRAASVGITPLAVSVIADRDGKVPVIDSCMLNEWSYCAVGVNQQALVKSCNRRTKFTEELLAACALQSEAALRILGRGTLDGGAILPAIRKSLLALAPKSGPKSGHSIVRGAEVAKMSIKLTSKQVKQMKFRDIVKSMTKMMDYDEQTQKMLTEELDERADEMPEDVQMSMGSVDDEELDELDSDEIDSAEVEDLDSLPATGPVEPAVEMQGSVVTRAGYDALTSAAESFRAQLEAVEADAYKAKVMKQLDSITDSLEAIAGYHAAQYPDAPSIAADEPDLMADQLKSFWKSREDRRVAASQISRVLEGLAEQIGTGKFDATKVSKSLRQKSGHLSRMIEQSRTASVVSTEEYEKLKAENSRLLGKLKDVDDVLQQLDSSPIPVG